MKKSICYLDQNFASNLAKVGNLPDWKDPLREFYSHLLQLLKAKVDQNRLICPTSYFHTQESEQNERVKNHVWYSMERLGHGLSVNSFTHIHLSQLALAAYAFSRKDYEVTPDWSIAFNQDPHEQVEPHDGEILVHLESGKEMIDYNRETTNLAGDVYGKFKDTRIGQSGTFEEAVRYCKLVILYETMLPPSVLIEAYPELASDISDIGAASVSENQAKLLANFKDAGVLESPEISTQFLNSQELMDCPFLHIRASLMAADIFHYPEMIPSPSLNTDFEIVASILPYVDILATDNHMAELIRRARLSGMFPAQVFSMNRRDDFLNELEKL